VTPNRRAIRPPDDDDDALVAAAAEEYLAGLRSGSGPSRQDLLARHPDLAPRLAACLEGLEFVHFSASEGAAPAPAGPDLLVAQPLSDFRLVRELGRGGMGVVYEADQLSLRRRVAVKILPAASSLDPRRLQRFLNEAHAAAQLQHANIVPVYGVGSDGGVHYYSMQLVRAHAQFAQSVCRRSRRSAMMARSGRRRHIC